MAGARYSIIPADAVFDVKLSRLALHVLAALGAHADNNGWCVVRQRTLAEKIGSSPTSVRNAISELLKLGYVRVRERVAENGARLSNYYQVAMDREPVEQVVEQREFDLPPAPTDAGPPHSHVRGPRTPTCGVNKNDPFLERPSANAEGEGSATTPRSELMQTLDAEHADAVVEHRKRIRAPLTAYAAKLLAKALEQCFDPNAAADAMIANGWRGFKPEWLQSQTRNAQRQGSKPRNVVEAAQKRLDDLKRIGDRNAIEHH